MSEIFETELAKAKRWMHEEVAKCTSEADVRAAFVRCPHNLIWVLAAEGFKQEYLALSKEEKERISKTA